MRRLVTAALAVLLIGSANGAWAVPTTVTVRVVSKDAKFVGSSMGGALVTIRDADTGELLARGLTSGTTGNTSLLMKEKITRRTSLIDEKSAKFVAEIDIDAPTRVEIGATGPMAQRQSTNTVSITQWLLPGKDIVAGNAVMLELPGFVVDVLSPPAHVKMTGTPEVTIVANVTMMCGCPLTPGGLWDSDGFEIEAVIARDGAEVARFALPYAGEASQFEAAYTPDAPGTYSVTVTAFDPTNGNTGLDRTTFIVK